MKKQKEAVAYDLELEKYNEKLVKRGEFYLNPNFLENWDEELEEMNEGKVGRPYKSPKGFVQFVALWYEFFHLLYRQLEGALRKLGELVPELEASDYTSLWHRFKDLELEIPESEDKVVVTVGRTARNQTPQGREDGAFAERRSRQGVSRTRI